eukprot:1160966-Pelagomonas_calceolata.AAC.12
MPTGQAHLHGELEEVVDRVQQGWHQEQLVVVGIQGKGTSRSEEGGPWPARSLPQVEIRWNLRWGTSDCAKGKGVHGLEGGPWPACTLQGHLLVNTVMGYDCVVSESKQGTCAQVHLMCPHFMELSHVSEALAGCHAS